MVDRFVLEKHIAYQKRFGYVRQIYIKMAIGYGKGDTLLTLVELGYSFYIEFCT